jgi:hypothetical protein
VLPWSAIGRASSAANRTSRIGVYAVAATA